MGKDGKRGKRLITAQAQKLRNVLAQNLELLLDRDYPLARFSNNSERQMKAAHDMGVSWSSIQRALDPKHGVTLDLVADLAAGFAIKPHEMLDASLLDSRHFASESIRERQTKSR